MFELSSPTFWVFFAVVTLVLAIKSRKGRMPLVKGKQVSLNGMQLFTKLSLETHLECLLADGKIYGEDYHDKEIPSLPHSEMCECRLERVSKSGTEWFQEKAPLDWKKEFNIDKPAAAHRRFLKYYLIINHNSVNQKIKEDYKELLDQTPLHPDVQKKIIESIHQSHKH
ncbi:MAG: hypothetical protein GY786_05070 [Proteobacteria bacterium]|nr:hypothetical protein [Pseudomonadota bacterium]